MSTDRRPHVVIIGGGFGGLTCARALARAPVRITLIDRRNFHLFQPLLYEVATATLSPADITASLRQVLAKQKNLALRLGEVTRIDVDRREVRVQNDTIAYDYLVVAVGVETSWFGHADWERYARGLKTVEDAAAIRSTFLEAFERAEWEGDPAKQHELLTFVVVGAGSTGMELAGSIAATARDILHGEYRNIQPRDTRVLLIEAASQVLPGFPPDLAAKGRRQIERLGVEVRTDERVTRVGRDGVWLGDEHIAAANVYWAAGVAGNPLARQLGAPLDGAGLVRVEPDCSIPSHRDVFVVGDLAHFESRGRNITGVAPAAIQMARFTAGCIMNDLKDRPRSEFRYFDKGTAATIARYAAVARAGHVKISGFPAWFIWVLIHIIYLTTFRNRVAVLVQWLVAWIGRKKGVRLILYPPQPAGTAESAPERREAAG